MKRKFIWWLGFVTLFVLFSVTAYGDNWPTVSQNYQRTGTSSASIDPSTLTLDWFFAPGVSNSLLPGFPGGTGFPVGKGGQSPAVGFGKVVYLYLDTDIAEILVGLDASTGALLWSHTVRGTGLGFAALQPPTIALRTVDAVTDTVVYIGGTNNSFRCVNANTGALIWNKTGLSGNMRNGCLVFDTLVISADNGSGGTNKKLNALNTRNGSIVWTSVSLDARTFSALSISNDTVFACTRPLDGVLPEGSVYAIDANTGAVIDQYDDASGRDFSNDVTVFDDNLLVVSRNELFNGPYASFLVWKNTHTPTAGPNLISNATAFGIDRFSIPNAYVDPSGETVGVYGTSSGGALGDAGQVVMRRMLPTLSFRSYTPLAAAHHGIVSTAVGNGVTFAGDDAGLWYTMDGNGYGAAFAGLSKYWWKQFPNFITAQTAISPDDDTVVVVYDGNGNITGWHNGHVTSRPRAELYGIPYTDGFGVPQVVPQLEVVLNITAPGEFNTYDSVPIFQNGGNEDLTYELNWGSSPLVLSAADFNNMAGTSISMGRVNSSREKLARDIVDDATITAGNAFMEKKYDISKRSLKQTLDMEAEGINSIKELLDFQSKASYFGTSKLEQAKATLSVPGWLFVNSPGGGNPSPGTAGPGEVIFVTLQVVGIGLNYGEYFGEIKLFNTNEPDLQGNPLDTTRVSVRLVVGFLPDSASVLAANAGVSKTNYGDENPESDVNWYFDPGTGPIHALEAVGGFFFLGNAPDPTAGSWGTYAGLNNQGGAAMAVEQPASGWRPDSLIEPEVRTLEGINYSWVQTKFVHDLGLPISVRLFSWGILDPIPGLPHAGDAVYQTFVITNTGGGTVADIGLGLDGDVDVPDFATNAIGIDVGHDAVRMYDAVPASAADIKFGWLRVPSDNINSYGADVLTGWSNRDLPGSVEYYGNDERDDTVHAAFDTQRKFVTHNNSDYNMTIGAKRFSLGPGESHTETFIWWGADTTDGETSLLKRYRQWLAVAGYYRGDVNVDGRVDITDAAIIKSYFESGFTINIPKPFSDQGDWDGDGVYTADDWKKAYNYIFNHPGPGNVGGPTNPAPVDRDRFVPDPWDGSRAPGLTNDINWLP